MMRPSLPLPRGPVTVVVSLALLLSWAPTAFADSPGRGVVHPNTESVSPLRPGDPVPSVDVRDIDGRSLDLAGLVAERGALLVFYRGGW